MKIGIVGCGTGGAAAALFLHRQGHQITVFERVPDPDDVGAGILMQPTGLDVLSDLDLLQPFLDHGARVAGLSGYLASGRQVFELDYATYNPEMFGVGAHRGMLFQLLYDALADAGIPVLTGIEITRQRQESDGRSSLLDSHAAEHGPFDLVIISDGARSMLRDGVPIPAKVHRFAWGVFWLIVPDPDGLYQSRLNQYFDSTRVMMGLLPTGKAHGQTGPPLVSMFWSIHRDAVEAWQAAGLESWKAEVRRVCPTADPILEQVHDPDQLVFAEYYDVRMPRWHTENTVIIGDAAHAMSPHLGQGANLALYDARVLADCLIDQPTAAALAEYSRRRRKHISYYLLTTRGLTPFYQSRFTPLALPRDLAFPLISKVPWIRDQMLRTLVGEKMGLFQ
jgi:2-polyprenyl-6-methoxyphenol hydroxylase-like FAD-dependent oxidoreductase